jgi:beta-lactamase regulating signal transducer with metallopeptidase domain
VISASGLADVLLRSGLLVALLWFAAVGVARAGGSAAMRHAIWQCGIAALVLFPVVSMLMPALPLPILPGSAVSSAPVAIDVPIPSGAIEAAAPAAVGPATPAISAIPAATIGLGDLLTLFYAAVAAGLISRLALGHWLLARLWKRSRPVRDAAWTGLIAEICASLGIRRAVDLRLADGPAMPMTWGSLRPRVLLPADARGWTEERRRIVLLHELAHVARHDSFGRAAAAIVCALYWVNPAVWYAAKQMRREQEHACDDLVLALGARASVYARNLLDAAHAFCTPRMVAGLGVAMASPSELELRLTAIIRCRSRRRAGLRFMTGCGTAALVATSLVASAVPVPVSSTRPPAVSPLAQFSRFSPSESAPPAGSVVPMRGPAILRPPVPPSAGRAPAPVDPPLARPAVPTLPAAPVVAAVGPRPSEEETYAREAAQYRRELADYRVAADEYRRQAQDHGDQVRALRALGNLANAGNAGNAGNTGNIGQPPAPANGDQEEVPAVLPTLPTWPTPPTPPVPLKPPQQGP